MDNLSLTYAALADPTRRAILQNLANGEKSVKDLVLPNPISGPGLTKHLKVLEKSGLISRSKSSQLRPCKLETAKLKEATEWMEQYKKFWEARFDQLETYLQQLQKGTLNNDSNKPS
jgi:DNA-binding transcriptional ArsR family regulator